jgi:hypothetical protein
MSDAKRSEGGIVVDVLSGTGLGLLLGMVVGLSTSPVVGVVVGGLTSLLAVFLGLQGGEESKIAALSKVQINGVRIGCFGLAAVLGVVLGLYVRINNPLAEAPEHQLARWMRAFPDNPVLARQMMISERSGLNATNLRFDPEAAGVAVTLAAGSGARGANLFSNTGARDFCRELAPERFANDTGNILNAYGDIEVFAPVATRVRALPAEHRLGALIAAHAMLCATQEKGQAR